MDKSSATYDRILQGGLELVSRYGFTGVSLNMLAERSNLSKSGLFAHFRSKEVLEIEILESAKILARQTVVQPALKASEGLPQLRALFQGWLGWAERSGLPGGCPFAAAMFELDDLEGAVKDYLLTAQQEWFDILRGFVKKAVELKQFDPKLDIGQLVWELHGVYLSHHVSQRFLKDKQATQKASRAFEQLVLFASSRKNRHAT